MYHYFSYEFTPGGICSRDYCHFGEDFAFCFKFVHVRFEREHFVDCDPQACDLVSVQFIYVVNVF